MKQENTKGKPWNVLSTIMWIALLAVEIFTGVLIWRLDMLPTKYLLIVLGLLALVAVLVGALLLRRQGKWQKKPGHTHQVIGYILSAVVISGCLVASSAISKVQETMDAVTKIPTVTALVNVYVLKENPAEKIEDAKDYTFAVTESFDWENTKSTIAKIRELIGSEVKTVNYPNVFAMVDAMYAKEVDALIVNSAYVDLVTGIDFYKDFTDKVKMLFEYSVEELVPVTPKPTKPTETTAASKDTQGASSGETTEPQKQEEGAKPFILYVSGYDSYGSRLYKSCSDVNILAVVNPQAKQILLVNTPRDYYIGNPAGDGALDKLTHCGLYGVEYSEQALEDLYNIDIDYYAQINFSGFQTLIDAVGGVVVYSDVSFSAGGNHFHVGDNYLNGSQALSFARERKKLAGGDNDRGKNQMKVIKGLINKMSSGAIITNYAQILDSLKEMFATSMPREKMAELVKMQLSDMAQWNVQSYAVTGSNSSGRNYSLPSMDVYIMIPNMETVEFAGELIERVLEGDTLTDADMKLN